MLLIVLVALVVTEALFHLSHVNTYHLDFELLSVFHSGYSDVLGFQGMIKTRKNCAKMARAPSDEHLKSAGFTQDTNAVGKCGWDRRAVLNKQDVLQILCKQVLLEGNEKEVFIDTNLEATVQVMIDFTRQILIGLSIFTEIFWRGWCALRTKMCVGMRTKGKERGILFLSFRATGIRQWVQWSMELFFMYALHSVLLQFSKVIRQKFIYNGETCVVLPLAE